MGSVKHETNKSGTTAISDSIGSSQQTAAQQAQSATTLLQQQLPYMEQLWGNGGALLGQDAGVTDQARGAWGDALNPGINSGVADVIANASQDMGLNFSRNTLPAIRRGSVGTGSLGGSRQGIAEGLAAGELARAQAGMSSQLYAGALDNASRERTAALSMSGAMQSLPWQSLESYGRVLGAPVMQSYGTSSAASQGSSATNVHATTDAFGRAQGDELGILKKS